MISDAAVKERGLGSKAKVFISYSRKDMDFANRLDTGLKARGFEPLIDRTEIYAFEEWWQRIEALISRADTVVFVLSPDSVGSEVALREVSFAASLNKRFAPIVCRRVDDKEVPEALAKLNFIFFDDAARFEESEDELAQALKTDIAWIRQHTEFGEAARRWALAKGPSGSLLRSPVLEQAERWIAARPNGAPAPTEETQAFIRRSRQAATRRRNILTGSLAAGLFLALVLAGLAYWQRGIAVEQRTIAQQNETRANEQRDGALLTQSRFLADLANQNTANGDAASAMLMALAALPDARAGISRPYAREAEDALYSAYYSLQEDKVLAGHGNMVRSVEFSPDGKVLATAAGLNTSTGSDWTARLWDVASGAQLHVLRGHEQVVLSAAFSPDGKQLVTASSDKTARLWDVATGQELRVLRHDDFIGPAVFSPDGKLVITPDDKAVHLWDAATGRSIRLIHVPYSPKWVALSPDGKLMVTIPELGSSAHLAELDSGQESRVFQHQGYLQTAVFSPDGKRLVTASWDKTAGIWDVASGKEIHALPHEDYVTSAAFSADGKRIVTGSSDQAARIWDAETGKLIRVLRGHESAPRGAGSNLAAAFSPDGQLVATASEDKTARLWDAQGRHDVKLLAHPDGVVSAAFTADGKYLVSVSGDKTLHMWDIDTGAEVSVADADQESLVIIAIGRESRFLNDREGSIAFSSDGKRVVTAGKDETPQLRDVASWKEIARLGGHDKAVSSFAFSPDDKLLVTASDDGTARLWNARTGEPLRVLRGHTGILKAAVFSPDGKQVLTTSMDHTARLWEAESGQEIRLLDGHQDGVTAGAFSLDGRRVVTASGDRTARVWDRQSGQTIQVLRGHNDVVWSAAFSPDAGLVVTASFDGTAQVWDVASGRNLRVFPLLALNSRAAFSPDGKRVMTIGNAEIRLWGVFPQTQELVQTAKRLVPRCLSRAQQEKAFLEPEPPAWCIEQEKWPYQTADWKAWLRQTCERQPANACHARMAGLDCCASNIRLV